MKGFVLHPEAYRDLEEIWEFIAADNLTAADGLIGEFYAAFRRLAAFPHQGYKRPDITSRPLRFLPLRDYVISYAPDEKPVVVIAVLHGRRSPRVVAALLRGRE